ncbi:MAG: ATP-binding protein [Polyangiaceae bacterium]
MTSPLTEAGEIPCQGARAPGRVLIVDDNADLVSTLAGVLAPHGVEVRTAARGDEALALAKAHGFEVALVDVKLPDTSGTDLIVPLREAGGGEVVLITGSASVDAALSALKHGAFAFVLKSFRPEELVSTVKQAVTKVRLKRSREELMRQYRALAELTDVLVVALDEANQVVLFNRKAAEMVDVAAEDARGKVFLEAWIPESERGRLEAAVTEARHGTKTREVETSFADLASGKAGRRIRWHFSPARESGGHSHEIIFGIGIDVTEKRALEKRAADAEALSAMGGLALNLAHEIRNPLNAAVLQLHLLKRDIDKAGIEGDRRATMQRRVDVVESEIGRLSRLLTEFLELARPRQIAREPVHIGHLLDEVLELERGAAEERAIKVVKDIAPDAGAALGDVEKLKQVVLNLVVNAMEAMKEGGTLTGRAFSEGSHVTVEIGDTGPGIDHDVLANVFDPFFTTKEAGTGLGLSIVRKIVDQHGGTVIIDSQRGEGTRVRVRLPVGR